MSEVTRILSEIDAGDPKAADQLLPLVYSELRKLAAQRLSHEKPGQTLQATALVHEAFLRLIGPRGNDAPSDAARSASKGADAQMGARSASKGENVQFSSRGHFFAAAAEAMRRILVEQARRKHRLRHGGGRVRRDLDPELIAGPETPTDILALNDALDRLAVSNPPAAELVKLRFFAGLTNEQAAAALEISPRRANQIWTYARAWLREEIDNSENS